MSTQDLIAIFYTMSRAAVASSAGIVVAFALVLLTRRWPAFSTLSLLSETLACVPAVIVSKLLASVLALNQISIVLVMFTTIFPTYAISKPFFSSALRDASAMMYANGATSWRPLVRHLWPFVVFPAVQSFRLLWPTALLVTMIAECSGSQGNKGFGIQIIPLLANAQAPWGFIAVCSAMGLFPFSLLRWVEERLAQRWGLERHLAINLATADTMASLLGGYRWIMRYSMALVVLVVLALIGVWLAGGFPAAARIFQPMTGNDWIANVFTAVYETILVCVVALLVGALLAFGGAWVSAYSPPSCDALIKLLVMLPQVTPLIVLISLFQAIFYRNSAVGFFAVVVSTVFFPMYECAVSRTQTLIRGARPLLLAAGINPNRAPLALIQPPIVDGLWTGAKIGATRAVAAAVIAGYLIPTLTLGGEKWQNFGLGGLTRATHVTELQQLAAIAIVAVTASFVLIDLTQTVAVSRLSKRFASRA